MNRSLPLLVQPVITMVVLVGLIGPPVTLTSDLRLVANSAFARGGSGSGGGCRHGLPSTASRHTEQPSESMPHASAPPASTQAVAR
jgi:hypothetical protein